jgi:hypothetical protein
MRRPDTHRAALVALLPKGTDVARFEAEFERIAVTEPAALERQRQYWLDQVRECDTTLAKLPGALLNVNALVAHRVACQTQADWAAQRKRGGRAWRYVELLTLAREMRIALGYTSGDKPHGPGIAYLRAAAAVLGLPLSPHTARRVLQVYDKVVRGTTGMHGESTVHVDTVVIKAPSN